MKYYRLSIFIFIWFSFIGCESSNNSTIKVTNRVNTIVEKPSSEQEKELNIKDITDSVNDKKEKNGYLWIDTYKLYRSKYRFNITDIKGDTMSYFLGTKIHFKGKDYDLFDEAPNGLINCEVFEPEYNLFIFKVNKINYDTAVVIIDTLEYYINLRELSHNIYSFQTPEEYVLSCYPLLNTNTPLRSEPNDQSNIIKKYEKYSYKPIEIEGDWLKVVDDKDCPLEDVGDERIEGWVRWRKDGEIVLDLRHTC